MRLPNRVMAARAGLRVVVIGAGISGILMGIRLRQRGFTDFVILEKADRLGGTWRDNVYPGVACDVRAHLYVYSFEPAAGWKTRYAGGADIQAYYERVARRYGVLPHIRYGQEIVSADWDGRRWRLAAADGTAWEADIVVGCSGRLHHPALPAIPGADSFAGASFHTARWDTSIDLRGRRLGLIGTGSTATQIVAATAGKVAALKLFQRTPQWVFPIEDVATPWWQRLLYRLSPARAKRDYHKLRGETEARGRAAVGDAAARAARDRQCIDALATVRDPVLRAKLTPDYEVGCKRLVMSGTFYAAVQQPGVEVVTDPIERIEPAGVRTRDGVLHEVDVLVFATGFDAHAYLRPMTVRGEGGVSLDEVWRDLPITYRSVAIPRTPNFFLINGPYSPGGTASVVGIVEVQADYVMQLIERVAADDVALAPRAAAARAWLDGVRARAADSVWGKGGCDSWYLDGTGTPTIDPTPLFDLAAQLAMPDWADWDILSRPTAALPRAA